MAENIFGVVVAGRLYFIYFGKFACDTHILCLPGNLGAGSFGRAPTICIGYIGSGIVCKFPKLQTNFVQAGEREAVTEIPDADSINHVVVFLTGVQPFPTGAGGSVYIRWPLPNGVESNWHYLGFISNEKPSAIFKVAQLHKADAQHSGVFGSSFFNVGTHGSAQLGIQVEALSEIQARTPSAGTQVTNQSTLEEFADKMVQNLVNHAQSYTVRLSRPDGLGFAEYIPLTALQQWFTNFSRRFQQNPYFWRTLNNS